MKTNNFIKSVAAIAFLISIQVTAQSKWYASTAIQFVGSNLQGTTEGNSMFLYGGFRYQTQNYYLSLSLPIIFGRSNSTLQSGNIFLPSDETSNDDPHMTSISAGLGDLYLNGSLNILKEKNSLFNLAIEGYVKFPTSSPNLAIGTGEFDYQVAIGLRKFINRFSLFAQFGYLFIGDTEEAQTTDPYTISLGLGYTFGYGEHSILLAYDSYTTIVQGIASPQQIAFGYNFMINYRLYFTAIVSAGLNSSTSDYTISGGLNFEL